MHSDVRAQGMGLGQAHGLGNQVGCDLHNEILAGKLTAELSAPGNGNGRRDTARTMPRTDGRNYFDAYDARKIDLVACRRGEEIVYPCSAGLVDEAFGEGTAVEVINRHLPPLLDNRVRERLALNLNRLPVLEAHEVGVRKWRRDFADDTFLQ